MLFCWKNMSYDSYNSVAPFYLSLLKNFHVFFYPKTDVNNRFQKTLWYNNGWVIHKRGGQNYFNKTDEVNLLHPLRALKKPNEIYQKCSILIWVFWILMKKIHFYNFGVFLKNIVSNKQNWISSLMVRAILNIFFCFKGLNESKLLSDQIS